MKRCGTSKPKLAPTVFSRGIHQSQMTAPGQVRTYGVTTNCVCFAPVCASQYVNLGSASRFTASDTPPE